MATGTLSDREYVSREKRQLKKKLIQEILCQLKQVNLDQLLKASEGRRQLWRA